MASASDAKKADKAAAEEPEAGKDGDAAAEPKRRRFAGKTLILFVVAPLLLLGGLGAGAHFMGLTATIFGSDKREADQKEQAAAPQPAKPNIVALVQVLPTGSGTAS